MLPVMMGVLLLLFSPFLAAAEADDRTVNVRASWLPGSYEYVYQADSTLFWGSRAEVVRFESRVFIDVAAIDGGGVRIATDMRDVQVTVNGRPIDDAPDRVPPILASLGAPSGRLQLGGEAIASVDPEALKAVTEAIEAHGVIDATFLDVTLSPGETWRAADPGKPEQFVRYTLNSSGADTGVASIDFRHVGTGADAFGTSAALPLLQGVVETTFQTAGGNMQIDLETERVVSTEAFSEMTLRLTFPGVPAPQQIRLESTQSLQLIE